MTIHFKHFDFIEWFDLNSNSSNLFERSSISDFLVDLIICVYIWFIHVKICSIRISSNNSNSMSLCHKLPTLFVFKISNFMIIFINFYSKFVFRKVSIKSFVFNTVLSRCYLSFKCNLQCAYDVLFATSNYVRI